MATKKFLVVCLSVCRFFFFFFAACLCTRLSARYESRKDDALSKETKFSFRQRHVLRHLLTSRLVCRAVIG